MNHSRVLALVALINTALFVAVLPAHAQNQPADPLPYSANYKASTNGLTASATRSLRQLDDGSFELVNELQARVLGQEIARLEQRSRFHYLDDSIRTDQYSYRLSGISSDQRAIAFDWQAGTALSTEDGESWTVPLQDQVFDPLSHQFVLSQQLQNGLLESYEFAVVDGDKIEIHKYQLVGEERLGTPLGNLNTVKLERVREGSSSRSTVIWLAPDWHYLLARIEQSNGSLQVKMELETAVIGDETVTPLATD